MKIDVLTLFPESIRSALDYSILKRAQENGRCTIATHQIRDYAENKHRQVDDMPYGGGSGMVMSCQPLFSAIDALNLDENVPLIYLSPKGRTLDQKKVKALASHDRLVLVCGHYEGIDQRVIDHYHMEELSIGDYILTGGELAALVVIDAVVRLKDGVLGDEKSHQDESFEQDLLEYPHYTRPEVYEGRGVPEMLLSGNHAKISDWRLQQSLLLTKERRPDLFEKFMQTVQTPQEKKRISKLLSEEVKVVVKRKK